MRQLFSQRYLVRHVGLHGVFRQVCCAKAARHASQFVSAGAAGAALSSA